MKMTERLENKWWKEIQWWSVEKKNSEVVVSPMINCNFKPNDSDNVFFLYGTEEEVYKYAEKLEGGESPEKPNREAPLITLEGRYKETMGYAGCYGEYEEPVYLSNLIKMDTGESMNAGENDYYSELRIVDKTDDTIICLIEHFDFDDEKCREIEDRTLVYINVKSKSIEKTIDVEREVYFNRDGKSYHRGALWNEEGFQGEVAYESYEGILAFCRNEEDKEELIWFYD